MSLAPADRARSSSTATGRSLERNPVQRGNVSRRSAQTSRRKVPPLRTGRAGPGGPADVLRGCRPSAGRPHCRARGAPWRSGGAARGIRDETRVRGASVEDRRQARVLGSCAHDFARRSRPTSRNGDDRRGRRRALRREAKGSAQRPRSRRRVGGAALRAARRIRQCAWSRRRYLRRRGRNRPRQPGGLRPESGGPTFASARGPRAWSARSISSSRTPPIFRQPTSRAFRAKCGVSIRALRSMAGSTGLDAYRAIFPEAARLLAPDGWLLVEASAGQAGAVLAIAAKAGFLEGSTRRDLAGVERVVVARSPRTTPGHRDHEGDNRHERVVAPD